MHVLACVLLRLALHNQMLLFMQLPRLFIYVRFACFSSGAAVCAQHMEFSPPDQGPMGVISLLASLGASLGPYVGSFFVLVAFPGLS